MTPRLRQWADRLDRVADAVEDGSLSPQQGQAIASLARSTVTVLNAGELEQRIAKLEVQHARQPA
jgi:hypothetical protein